MKIAVLVGSARGGSYNVLLAKNLARSAGDIMVQFQYIDIASMPFFSEDTEQYPPESVEAARVIVRDADAVLFVTPEYNRGIPGILKNAIDWLSRGDNVFFGKAAAITGASIGRFGTIVAQSQLKAILVYLGMDVMGSTELAISTAQHTFDEHGVVQKNIEASLVNFMNNFIAHVGNNDV